MHCSHRGGPFLAEKRWREMGSALLRHGRHFLPAVISVGLVAWLIWKIKPRRLLEALSESNWPWLIAATGVQVVVLFLWDTVCVWWLFSQPDRRLPFRTVFRLRCDTVIWSAVSLEIGQAAFAWKLAKALHIPLTSTLGRCVLLGLTDFVTLLSLALAGSFVHTSSLTRPLRWICVGGLAGVLLLALLLKFMPNRWWRRLVARPWAGWLAWLDWRTACVLWGLRLVLFLLVLSYVGVGLAISRVPVDVPTVFGIIPFVLLAEAIPGTAGLGARETGLVYFYPAGEDYRAILLSFGLIWSGVVILLRVLIGLVSWSLPRAK